MIRVYLQILIEHFIFFFSLKICVFLLVLELLIYVSVHFTFPYQESLRKLYLMDMQEEGVLRGQELENAALDADYMKAIQLAIELHKPHKLFELFSGLCRFLSLCNFFAALST